MLKVAIVGCGKIADAHASQILRISDCEIVGVCDCEPLMAKQLQERFPIKHYFSDLNRLLAESRPDVVHITTPAESHYEIGKTCLESGCHIYVEKPFTIDAEEARALIDLAGRSRLKLTAGHSDQFSHVARRMRALVAEGYLGDGPVHMESHYGYDLGDPSYARALFGDRHHWVRRLPGKLLQNVISHGLARIAEFLTSDSPEITAYGFISPLLRSIKEYDVLDELRVIISEDQRTTAYFTFSSSMRPSIHELRIYGTKNGLILDHDHDILLRLRGSKFKSYADKFIPPLSFAKQNLENLGTNLRLFFASDFHMDSGMKQLIELFYGSIRHNTPLPISYREILLVSTMMDNIFKQLAHGRVQNRNGTDAPPEMMTAAVLSTTTPQGFGKWSTPLIKGPK